LVIIYFISRLNKTEEVETIQAHLLDERGTASEDSDCRSSTLSSSQWL